jgi:hypothetical protein
MLTITPTYFTCTIFRCNIKDTSNWLRQQLYCIFQTVITIFFKHMILQFTFKLKKFDYRSSFLDFSTWQLLKFSGLQNLVHWLTAFPCFLQNYSQTHLTRKAVHIFSPKITLRLAWSNLRYVFCGK